MNLTRTRARLAAAAFVLFIMGGYVKADPRLSWVPIDLTLVGAAMTAAFVAAAFVRVRRKLLIPKSALSIVMLWCAFAFPVLLPGIPLDLDKVGRLFSITLLAALAPLFLIRSRDDVRTFVAAFGIAGLLMAVDAMLRLLTGGGVERLAASGGSTIALGRSVGMALLWVLALALTRRIPMWLSLCLIPFLGVVLLGSGSRGPLAFAAISSVLMVALVNRRQAVRLGLVFGAVAVAVTQYAHLMPAASIRRILRLLQGAQDRSVSTRFEAIDRSVEFIINNPLGIGWGGFAREIALWGSDPRQYPHNIVVEVALEAGWIPALLFIAFCVFVWRRAWTHPERLYLVPFVAFVGLNALVSGDINDNRIMFAVFSIAIAVRTPPKSTSGDGPRYLVSDPPRPVGYEDPYLVLGQRQERRAP